jgi:hypothetical protein
VRRALPSTNSASPSGFGRRGLGPPGTARRRGRHHPTATSAPRPEPRLRPPASPTEGPRRGLSSNAR